jgi:DNA-binding MarR family transcriptional regulator
MKRDVLAVLVAYPQIWHSCHLRHPRGERSGHGVTERELGLLAHLTSSEPMSPKLLARHLGVTAGTLSAAIEALVERGLVRRERRADDRRRQNLTLTADGERALVHDSVLDAGRVRRALGRLPAEQRAAAVRGISLLAQACRGVGGRP